MISRLGKARGFSVQAKAPRRYRRVESLQNIQGSYRQMNGSIGVDAGSLGNFSRGSSPTRPAP
jgi:hypothetical protein